MRVSVCEPPNGLV